MPDNKIAPLKNYLRRIVIKEHRDLLNQLLENRECQPARNSRE